MPDGIAATNDSVRGESDATISSARYYDDVREEMRDGDLLLWGGRYRISRIVKVITGGRYSHVAIIAEWGQRLMVLEAAAREVRAVPLRTTVKQYDGLVDWYRIRAEKRNSETIEKILEEARKDLGIRFGLWKAAVGLLRRMFNLRLSRVDASARPTTLFCAEYVSRCFRIGGMDLDPNRDEDTFPVELSASPVVEFAGRIRYGPRPTS